MGEINSWVHFAIGDHGSIYVDLTRVIAAEREYTGTALWLEGAQRIVVRMPIGDVMKLIKERQSV